VQQALGMVGGGAAAAVGVDALGLGAAGQMAMQPGTMVRQLRHYFWTILSHFSAHAV